MVEGGRRGRRGSVARLGAAAGRPRDAVPRRGQVPGRIPAARRAPDGDPARAQSRIRSPGNLQSASDVRRFLRLPRLEAHLADFIKDTAEGCEAEAILRTCVHCGFCTATCPTYQLLGDELDGPRGRIYLMKQMLEGEPVTAKTQLHLDRCLTCRSCETTCPSGVRYGRLVEIGREVVEAKVPRSAGERMRRWLLRRSLLSRPLFGAAVAVGRLARPVLPRSLAAQLPRAARVTWRRARHARRMLVLHGC